MGSLKTASDVVSLLARAGGLVILGLYLLVISHIPLLEFFHRPTLLLGVWLVLAPIILGLGVWLLYRFSLKFFLVWLMLLVAFNVMIWHDKDVARAFEIDSCLDRGGMWNGDESCEGPAWVH